MKLLSHEEILETLDVTRQTLWRMRQREDPRPVFTIGGKLKCRKDELMQWIQRQQQRDGGEREAS